MSTSGSTVTSHETGRRVKRPASRRPTQRIEIAVGGMIQDAPRDVRSPGCTIAVSQSASTDEDAPAAARHAPHLGDDSLADVRRAGAPSGRRRRRTPPARTAARVRRPRGNRRGDRCLLRASRRARDRGGPVKDRRRRRGRPARLPRNIGGDHARHLRRRR